MDDGSIFKRKKKTKDGVVYYLKPSCKLCTHSFSREDCERILDWLKRKYKINGYITVERKRNRIGCPEYYVLTFNCENTEKIYKIIKPFIECNSMKKKFEYLIAYYEK